MGTSKRHNLIEIAEARAAQQRKQRLAEQGPLCAWSGCQQPFTPVRPHQKCCGQPQHRYKAWLESRGGTR